MVELTAIARGILRALAEQYPSPVPARSLAQRLRVTPRTIRYHLDFVDAWLAGRAVRVRRAPAKGMWLEGDAAALQAIVKGPELTVQDSAILSPPERRRMMAVNLLQSAQPLNAAAIARRLRVSRTTVFNDLRTVRQWLRKHGLELVSRGKKGISVSGPEYNWRLAVCDLLENMADSGQLSAFLRECAHDYERRLSDGAATGDSEITEFLEGVDLHRVQSIVRSAEPLLGLRFADGAFAGMAVHIAIAIRRLSSSKTVSMPAEKLAYLKRQKAYAVATVIASRIERAFGLQLPEAEVGYITMHLLGAKLRENIPGATPPDDGGVCATEVARTLISRAQDTLGLDLSGDQLLLSGLASHLRPIIHRLRLGLPIANPFFEAIRSAYPQALAAARSACRAIRNDIQIDVPEEEVGYVAMHLAASLERRRQSSGTRRVLVVCACGLGGAQILRSRLETELPELQIVKTVPVDAVDEAVREFAPDLLISTIRLPNAGPPTVCVNPLLPREDIERIRDAVSPRHASPREEP